MGCELYRVVGPDSEVYQVRFAAGQRCLCCFGTETIDELESSPSWQRALMMLGAAVVLVHRGQLGQGTAYLPGDLSARLVEAIGRIIPRQDA